MKKISILSILFFTSTSYLFFEYIIFDDFIIIKDNFFRFWAGVLSWVIIPSFLIKIILSYILIKFNNKKKYLK